MAVVVQGLKEFRRDVRRLASDSDRDLTRGLRTVAQPILEEARRLAPRSSIAAPGHRHIRDTLSISVRAGSIAIRSTKPGARTIHWGGRHPLFGNEGRWYPQKGNPFISRAVEESEDRIVDAVGDAVMEHARRIGWH